MATSLGALPALNTIDKLSGIASKTYPSTLIEFAAGPPFLNVATLPASWVHPTVESETKLV